MNIIEFRKMLAWMANKGIPGSAPLSRGLVRKFRTETKGGQHV